MEKVNQWRWSRLATVAADSATAHALPNDFQSQICPPKFPNFCHQLLKLLKIKKIHWRKQLVVLYHIISSDKTLENLTKRKDKIQNKPCSSIFWTIKIWAQVLFSRVNLPTASLYVQIKTYAIKIQAQYTKEVARTDAQLVCDFRHKPGFRMQPC